MGRYERVKAEIEYLWKDTRKASRTDVDWWYEMGMLYAYRGLSEDSAIFPPDESLEEAFRLGYKDAKGEEKLWM